MRWSFPIGRLFDVPVYVHATFPLLLAWIALEEWLRARSLAQSLASVLFVLAIPCVALLIYLGRLGPDAGEEIQRPLRSGDLRLRRAARARPRARRAALRHSHP